MFIIRNVEKLIVRSLIIFLTFTDKYINWLIILALFFLLIESFYFILRMR